MTGPGSGGPPDDPERDDESRVDHRTNDDSRGNEPASPADSERGPNRDGSESASAGDDAARGDDGVSSRAASNGGTDRPARNDGGDSDDVRIDEDGVIRWFLGTDNGTVVVVRDVASSVGLVVLVGLLLFGVSGIWPPMVAVESGSMEPNMQRGDLVFIVEADRFVGDGAIDGTGVVTRESAGDGHEKFGQAGDVIVFRPGGSDYRTPVIHRAHFWVEEGENWVAGQADPDHLNGETCSQLQTCPAPHDGFVTKGDNNAGYDQAHGGARTTVVRPDWVTGKAMFRIPLLGHVRLTFDAILSTATVGPTPGAVGDLGHSPGIVSATGGSSEPAFDPPSASGQVPNPDHPAGGLAIVAVTGSILALGRRRFAS